MNATQMIALMNQKPFETLEIHLNNGVSVLVSEPYLVSVTRGSATITVYGEGCTRHVSYRNIAEVVSRPAKA